MAELIVMPFGLRTRVGPGNQVLDGGPNPPWEETILGKGAPIVKYRDTLRSPVGKQLNQSICRLGCGLGWATGSTSSIAFARWCPPIWAHWRHLANTIEPSGCDAVLCQITLTTCYYYYYYYQAVSSMVCPSVCLSVTLVSPAKMAELIEMPFGLRTRVGPRNHVFDRVHIAHGKGQF